MTVIVGDALQKYLTNGSIEVHFSQLGEDIIVYHYIQNHFPIKDRPGRYIDVGANHPYFLSNTALFYELGWSGINIDANVDLIKLFEKERPRDICIAAGVGREEGRMPFYQFKQSAFSTFNTKFRDAYLGAGLEMDVVEVAVMPLKELLAPHLQPGDPVDYLNIDIEGDDLLALETYDFDNFAPTVISIEIHALDLNNAGDHPTVKYLRDRGYYFGSYNIATGIFFRSDRL